MIQCMADTSLNLLPIRLSHWVSHCVILMFFHLPLVAKMFSLWVQVMRDHGPVHLGDVDHAISKFTAEMRQHGAPWQVEGGTKRSGWSLLKVFCLREIWLWFKGRGE